MIWVQNDQVQYVSTSAHGNFDIHTRDQIRFDGTHAKVVYHKDGIGTHAFRAANGNDDPPENHHGTWQFPRLVGWNGYPAGLRDKLSQANFGSAVFGLKDGNFNGHLVKAKPPVSRSTLTREVSGPGCAKRVRRRATPGPVAPPPC